MTTGATDGARPGQDAAPPAIPALRLDLHVHTRASWDCLSDPDVLLDRAEREGLGRIAFTDHNRLEPALALHRLHPERVIPGEEVRTREGVDLIGLYLRREIPKDTPAREVCERIRDDGGIIYLPHPFAPGKGQSGRFARELAPLVDVVEVFNARLHPGRLNDPAVDLAREYGKLSAAGSDAHTLGEVGGAWVEVPLHPNRPEALLEALRQGSVHGTTTPLWVHLASTWAKIRKALPGGG